MLPLFKAVVCEHLSMSGETPGLMTLSNYGLNNAS